MIKKFRVFIPEVHYQATIVEAENKDEARKAVLDGQGETEEDDNSFQYSHTLDNDWQKWDVEEVK